MNDSTAAGSGLYESKTEEEAKAGGADYVQMWLSALSRSEGEEEAWRKSAEKAIETYRGKRKTGARNFNILHSNVETLCPALYNSTPAPDVRRRFSDKDPVAKVVADILERALEVSVDTYDFDAVMKAIVRDGEIVGRGIPRVRYVPIFGDDGMVADENVVCDYVPWKYFRRGPGRTWKDVPWIAFGDFLSKEQIGQLNPEMVEKVPLNYTAEHKDDNRKGGSEEQSIFKRGLVWQIWDKDNRKVISICPDHTDAPVAVLDDPLGLTGFYPIPRPYQPINAPDSLTPTVPFDIYADLVMELNEVTGRISKLVREIRARGLYNGAIDAGDLKTWAEADDGELVPSTSLAGMDDVSKAIAWYPLEPTVKALVELIKHRNEIKQAIYEITGISDILRGSTQASETATAQQIKTQWGSLRIQDRQTEVARVARDLFRLKAEIIATKFSWDTLTQMTGIRVQTEQERAAVQMQLQQASQPQQQPMPGQPPAAPQIAPEQLEQLKKAASDPTREEAEKLLRSDVSRAYRIDIESDSTIRGDLTRNQQTMNQFLEGTARFAQSMGPIVMQFPPMLQPAMEVYTAFARNFKLGKQAEDALDSLADAARQMSQQKPKTDPAAEAAQAKAQAEMQTLQLKMQVTQAEHGMKLQELQMKSQAEQAKMEREFQTSENNAAHDQRKLQFEEQNLALKGQELAMKAHYEPQQQATAQ